MEFSDKIAKESSNSWRERGPEFAYLSVDAFMQDIFSARALATAFEIGLIDALAHRPNTTADVLAGRLGVDDGGFLLLLGLLEKGRVVSKSPSGIQLTDEFRHALQFRDLMQMKLSTANFGAHDLLAHFTDMIRHPRQSIGKLEFCRLFAYDKGLQNTSENYKWTKRWMHITSTLTRYEAPVCMRYHDFAGYSNILDVGGNSGEFALQLCRRHHQLRGVVFDLPVVCRIGREHVASQPEAERISFLEGNALNDDLPSDFDLVSFKSMLHDWPDVEARRLLDNGVRALRPGGTILIFERAPLQSAETSLSFAAIPFLLFFGAFRSSALYEEQLMKLGLTQIEVQRVELETPFHLITARKAK